MLENICSVLTDVSHNMPGQIFDLGLINKLVNLGLMKRLVHLTTHPRDAIKIATLTCVGNLSLTHGEVCETFSFLFNYR